MRFSIQLHIGIAALSVLASSCASRVPLRAKSGMEIRSIKVVSALSDTALAMPRVDDRMNSMGGLGLLGRAVGAAFDASAEARLSQRMHSLRDASATIDLQALLTATLDSMVAAASWPERRSVEPGDVAVFFFPTQRARLESGRALRDGINALFEDNETLLVLKSTWGVSRNAEFISIETRAELLVKPGIEAEYETRFVYASDISSTSDVDTALAEWTRDDASMLRRVLASGAREIATMVTQDFFAARGAPMEIVADEEFTSPVLEGFENPIVDGKPVGERTGRVIQGKVLGEHDGRLLVRAKNGFLYSMPAQFRQPLQVFRHHDYYFFVSHQPSDRACVYAHHPTGDAQIWIDPSIEVAPNSTLTPFRVGEVTRVVRERESEIRAAWDRVHGRRDPPASKP